MISVLMIQAALVMAFFAPAWPPPSAILCGLVAVLLPLATPLFVRIERKADRSAVAAFAIMLAAVNVPMAAFGMAMAQWYEVIGGDAVIVVAVTVLPAIASSILLTNRPTSKLLAQLGLWGGLSSIAPSPAVWLLLCYGAAVSLYLAHRDAHTARIERQRQSEIERAQFRAEEMLAEYEDSGLGWFWETDRRGTITYVSPHIGQLLGKDSRQLVGRPFTELFILNAPGQVGERTLSFHLTARSSFQDLAVRAATPEEERWWSINGRPSYDEFDNFLGFRGSGSDLTEKRRSQERASRLAHYDSLTGLANRFQMSQSLEKILNARQEEHRACSVFLLDLDRFKQVNDTLGHPAGDALLKQVAQRLTAAVSDLGRVGRLGGDEFQVIVPGRLPRAEHAHLAQRIIESLSRPYEIDGHRVVIGASVGIAMSPDDGVTSEAIIRNADLALYAAKDNGRG
jgi:diguanylate cyclase (GGDEF)-like protein/PAS domain S-box-containing protein